MKKFFKDFRVGKLFVVFTLMFGIVLTLVSCKKTPKVNYLEETEVQPTGVISGVPSANGKFYTDYGTFEDQQRAASELAVKVAEEGQVLLKNDNGTLPLTSREQDLSVFGVRSVDLQTGGGGSGSGTTGANGIKHDTLLTSLKDAGYNVNPKLVSLYETKKALGIKNEIPVSEYSKSIISTYRGYGDAAIVTLTRTGSEDIDLQTYNVPGHSNASDHYLQLDDNEKDLIKHTKKYFSKVIVVINSANIMEVSELNAKRTDDNLGVDAILWVAHTGNNGAKAIGRILNGSVNPSGKTVDIWAADFKKGPTWTNFGDNKQNIASDGTRMNNSLYYGSEELNYYTVEYREGIYVGYKYYETVMAEMNKASKDTGTKWYDENVVYPFGYGLSYTNFKWELTSDIAPSANIISSKQTITLKVKVTNTGDTAGKDVVQLYYSAPYKNGGIEKAEMNLVEFGKTEMLQPGESQTLTLQIVAQNMASFDYDDKNANGFVGYELEAGDYKIILARNSNERVIEVVRTVKDGIKITHDYISGNEIKPVFTGAEGLEIYKTTNESLENNKISRTNLKQPTAISKEDRTVSLSYKNYLDGQRNYYSNQDKTTDLWYVKNVPSNWTQNASYTANYANVKTKLVQMTGISYVDRQIKNGEVTNPTDAGTKAWDDFMNQLTWDDLKTIVSKGNRRQAAIPAIGKEEFKEYDGPAQISGGTFWPSAVIVSATFNKEIAGEIGRMVGNESIFTGVSGWYAPSMNTHRSPFGGRNFEYYSEDGVHAGIIASAVTKGVVEKGTVVYIKHMFLNDQEKWRSLNGGVQTWADEQTIREIYAKPFEMSVKLGGANGIMSAFNRIGDVTGSVNYAMNEALLRDEWGFRGVTITDAWADSYRPVNLLVRTGQELVLGDGSTGEYRLEGEWDATKGMVVVDNAAKNAKVISPTHYFAVRRAAQRILYNNVVSNANKNAIVNGFEINIELEQGVSNTVQIKFDEKKFGSADVVATLKAGEQLPDGVEIDGVVVSGTPTDMVGFEKTVILDLLVDGWVKVEAKLNIKLVSAIQYTGDDLLNIQLNKDFSGKFSSNFYQYERIIESRRIVNWYMADGKPYVGHEHWSAEDIKTIDPKDPSITERHVYEWKIKEGTLPSGLVLNSDGTISGKATETGEFVVTVELVAPYVTYVAPWMNPNWGRGEFKYTHQIKISVK